MISLRKQPPFFAPGQSVMATLKMRDTIDISKFSQKMNEELLKVSAPEKKSTPMKSLYLTELTYSPNFQLLK